MDYLRIITAIRQDYDARKASFTKNELRYLTGRTSLRGRLLGFMTRAYYQRPRLFKKGQILYALTFRRWSRDLKGDPLESTWVLFSPMSEFDAEPERLYQVKNALDDFLMKKTKKAKYHALMVALKGELSEPAYLEIPSEFTDGRLVYLSYICLRREQIPDLRLGLNLIVADRSVSKEVLYLPAPYWTKEYTEHYHQGSDSCPSEANN